jgi:hypothetical protein
VREVEMRRTRLSVFVATVAFLMTVTITRSCPAQDSESGINRYQIYSIQTFSVLLDTETGKIWKINTDMTGKMKAEGISVEGLAYADTEQDTLNNKIKDINLDLVSEKNKKECKDKIFADFAYTNMDIDKINKTLRHYREVSR